MGTLARSSTFKQLLRWLIITVVLLIHSCSIARGQETMGIRKPSEVETAAVTE
jgi:hypothetical protein